MIRPNVIVLLGAGLLALGLAGGPGGAQEAATPPAGAPPGAGIAPAPGTPASPPPAAGGAASALPTLIPTPGDPVDVDEVTIPSKPTAVLPGTSSWDDGFANLAKAFERLGEELRRAGIPPAGRPITVFVQTDDQSFKYEAMIPVERVPEGRPTLGEGVRFGVTPAGKALRFVHKGAYDDIDSTYETITAYLDAKGVIVKDVFIEEYATDPKDPSDPNLEINIFAVPK